MSRWLLRGILILLGTLLCAELLLQAAGVYTRWHYRQDAVLLRPDTVRVLCLGDSNTYGLYLPREQSWPGRLQALLDATEPGRYQVINLGVPATPSFRILENLPAWLQTMQPDHVIVLAGVNDLLFGSRDASTTTPTTLSWQRVWQHSRLARLLRLWLNRQSAVTVQHSDDHVQQTLDRLPTLDPEAATQALAALYRPYAERMDAIDLVQEGTQYWLQGFGQRILLNDAAERLRTQTDGFQRYQIYLAVAGQLLAHAPADFQMPPSDSLRVNDHAFVLDPLPLSSDHTAIQSNLGTLVRQVEHEGATPLLLGYASNAHFYGQANRLIAELAARESLPFLEMASHLQPHCRGAECSNLFFPDQHPNAEGYRLMAERIAQRLLHPAP